MLSHDHNLCYFMVCFGADEMAQVYLVIQRASGGKRIRDFVCDGLWAGRIADLVGCVDGECPCANCVQALMALANAAAGGQGRRDEAHKLRLQALELARQQEDAQARFLVAGPLLTLSAPQQWRQRLRIAEEATEWSREGVSVRALPATSFYSGVLELAYGKRSRAEQLWNELDELAARTRHASATLFVLHRDVILSTIGDFETAFIRLNRFVQSAEDSGA